MNSKKIGFLTEIFFVRLEEQSEMSIYKALALRHGECQHLLCNAINPGKLEKEPAVRFTPLQDRVLIRPIDGEEKTAGGLIVPDSAQEKPQEGEIVAVGTGKRGDSGDPVPLTVKAGDRVLFGKWSGTEVKLDGEDLLIMSESDVLGILT